VNETRDSNTARGGESTRPPPADTRPSPESRSSSPESRVPHPELPVIHAVTDDLIISREGFLERARAVMGVLGARAAVHLRARVVPAARVYELATELAAEQERTGCWLVINDRVDVALAAGSRGVQLTSRSMAVGDARLVAAGLALGASVHSASDAERASREGADWIVVGHVFQTPSHAGEPGRGVGLIRDILASASVPCIAIGGIRPTHVAMLLAAGAHGVAAIRGMWESGDAEQAAIDYLSAYEAHRDPD
jgi:thiamine-phosphate diphosphorylase